jgi:diguanylate cyclase (GGDEF)-like protein
MVLRKTEESEDLAPIQTGGVQGTEVALNPDGAFAQAIMRTGSAVSLDEPGPAFGECTEEIERLREAGISVCVPLMVVGEDRDGTLEGLLCFGSKILKQPFSFSELRFMTLLGSMIGIAIHNAQLHRKSIVDGLTQLFSRGHFDMYLHKELARASRYLEETPGEEIVQVTLILLDVDHFKSFNDTYGHQVGDEVLRTMGRILRQNIRQTDVVSRYGGEEFALIATETPLDLGIQLAERLRTSVENTPLLVDGKEVSITASFGVAEFPGDAEGFQDLVAKADSALYTAKELGRNRVMSFRDSAKQ